MAGWGDLLGYAAATLTTCSFVPQVWHTWRSRDVSGISLGMYAVFTLGVFLWLCYGWLAGAWPIVVANAITLSLALAILAMKLRWQRA
ncbi:MULTISPECIES: SemiSWEET transporter [Ramlibacter]|uniref:SemiSWEET transporter n=1 Tax=Ramlibacter aquaticus TaxID=2780094 RepID=A0ABR9SBS5_9BURK|nr:MULTISPECIES: SemiSWEET transporter [Ramlibacter]MBE7939783.1 SemiSWEET transporter [Ramlibacter aquaticus]